MKLLSRLTSSMNWLDHTSSSSSNLILIVRELVSRLIYTPYNQQTLIYSPYNQQQYFNLHPLKPTTIL